MNARPDIEALAAGLIAGQLSESDLDELNSVAASDLIESLIAQAPGRRWLRGSSLLTEELANRLIEHRDDFKQRRHDATLELAVRAASADTLVDHAVEIAGGSGAPALWSRLGGEPSRFQQAFDAVQRSGDAQALEATATHLLLDPTKRYGLSADQRQGIAAAIIDSEVDAARAVAAEFLAGASPETLAERLDRLAHDEAASVRGFAWFAAFRVDRLMATERASELLGNEAVNVDVRRSALSAAGETLPTGSMIELLSYFVVHPNRELALDAASLLHRHHRHPEIAIAAAGSPHDEVREIAERLMDPYRGSPAAGGSRPGDPLRVDPLMQLMRQLEEETEE